MKKSLIFIIVLICASLSYAQEHKSLKVYLSNPYYLRQDVIKTCSYNMDHLRCHYASAIYTMEQNYVRGVYDSISSIQYVEVSADSISSEAFFYGSGPIDVSFEPVIILDFELGKEHMENEYVWTFALDRRGYIFITSDHCGGQIFYPNTQCLNFLKHRFAGLFSLCL